MTIRHKNPVDLATALSSKEIDISVFLQHTNKIMDAIVDTEHSVIDGDVEYKVVSDLHQHGIASSAVNGALTRTEINDKHGSIKNYIEDWGVTCILKRYKPIYYVIKLRRETA